MVHIYTDHKSLKYIIVAQRRDKGMRHIKRRMLEGDLNIACFREDAEGTLWFKDRFVVPKRAALKKKILDEAHMSRYSIHPGSTKMYHDLRQHFWWIWMKPRPLAMCQNVIPAER
jgi:hypothetical protein